MAAGRFDVARRDVHCAKKESYHYRNRHRNGYSSYVGTIETGGGQGRGFVGRTRDRAARGRSGDAFASESRAGDNEFSKFEDGVSMPLEKKRKLSPIVWDRDDKKVRITSKNRIVPYSDPLCSPPSLPESFGKSMNVPADVDSTVYPITTTKLQGMQISPIKSHAAAGSVGNGESERLANTPSLLPPEICRINIKELGQVEGDEYIEVRHISTSRWAYEEDSLGEICLDNSCESVEFRGKGSEGSQGKSSASDGQDIFMDPASRGDYSENMVGNDDFVGISEIHDEVAGVSHLDLDLEDDKDSFRFEEPASPKPRSMNMLQGCRSVFEYEKLSRINEGTYGVVYKARDKKTNEIMALKKVKMGRERDGFPLSALREINILMSLHHPSVVDVKEVVVDNCDNVFMVMEYMEHDLKELIDEMKQPFSENEVKCLMLQLVEGVKHLHDYWVLHRDLKTSNLLLNKSGKLKICDFGLSRQYGSPLKPYTPLVVTLWYRAPELLLGTEQYSTAIDMWSVGCIMAELLAKQPLFNGKTEFDQLDKIFRILGTPNDTVWPGFSKLPGAKIKFNKQLRNTSLREKFPAISFKGSPVLSDQGFELLSQLLTYDPEKRITADAALKHSWFHVESEQELHSIQKSLSKRLESMTYG